MGILTVQPNFDDDMAGGDSYDSIELELDMPDMEKYGHGYLIWVHLPMLKLRWKATSKWI